MKGMVYDYVFKMMICFTQMYNNSFFYFNLKVKQREKITFF